jgi:hypothetical protein
MTQWQTNTVTGRAQVPLVTAGDGPALIANQGSVTIYLGDHFGIAAATPDVAPVSAGGFVAVDGENDVYAVCATGNTAQVVVVPGGTSFFQLVEIIVKTIIIAASLGNGLFIYSGTPSPSNLIGSWVSQATTDQFGTPVPAGLSATVGNINGTIISSHSIPASAVNFVATDINGITTYIQGTTPPTTLPGSIWIDTSNGNRISQLTGGVWSPYTFGTGSITANSIGAAQIVANSIGVGQLAAGIIYAGIINGTTVNAATFTGSTFQGTNFIINSTGIFFYSGTPAVGNLTGSWTNSNTDPLGNTTYPTFASYGANSASQLDSGFVEIFQLAHFPANKGGMVLGAFGAATQEIVLTSGNVGATDHAAAIGLISSSTPEILMTLNAVAILDLLAAGSTLNSPLTIDSTTWPTLLLQNLTPAAAGVEVVGSGGNWALAASVPGDTNPRVIVYNTSADGIAMGPGNAGTDIRLFRSSAGTYEISQSLVVGNSLQVLVNTILGGTQIGTLQMNGTGVNISGQPLSADTWHSLGALSVTGVTLITGRYTLMPDGDVEIDILFSTSGAVATFSQNFANTLPAAYQPTANKMCAIGVTGASWTISGSRLPNVLVSSSGSVQVNMPAIPGAVGNMGCTFRFPTK